ncbi:MAG: electron transfer flavoprotein subunit beta, partial [Clostridiales bacterium]|nr:electron transfer flavoprotein subunit beta [Clostridiales bacterium]
LEIANISYARSIAVDGDELIVHQQFEDRQHVVRAGMPVLITALSEMNIPRYMTPGGIFDAFRTKEIITRTRKDVPVSADDIGLSGSPTRVHRSFPKTVKAPGMKIEQGVDESVQFIMDKLHEKYIL